MVCPIAVAALVVLLPVQVAPPATPKREAETLVPLVVHVVDATSHEAAAGVDVTCVAMTSVEAEVKRRWCGAQRWFDPIEFDEVTRALGTTKRSDEHGDVTFERLDGELRVIAADELRFGAMRVQPSEPPAATLELKPEAHDDVYVVDENGKSVAGVPVAAGWGFEDALMRETSARGNDVPKTSGWIDDAWPAAFDGVSVTSAPDGRARFPHASKWLGPGDKFSEVAILGFPVPNRVQIALARQETGTRLELVLPLTGRVVLHFPGVARGVCQLRNESSAFWRDFEPARAAIVDGTATFPWVGVGAKTQFRAHWEGLSSPVEGKLDGPQHKGDVVEFTAAGAPTIPVFLARLVDEDGQPVSGQELEFSVRRIHPDGKDDGENVGVTTGRDGRVRFTLVDETPDGGTRYIDIHVPWYAKASSLHQAGCRFDMTPKFGPGVHELGDVVLHVPGSGKCLRSVPDSELERIYRDACDRKPFSSDALHDKDTCLTEMIRRGGSHWTAFIAAELEGARPDPDEFNEPDESDAPAKPKSVCRNPRLLTALRRVQHRPDPVLLEVEGAPVIETVFPEVPALAYRFKNVDDGGETLCLGNFDRGTTSSRIEVRGADGSIVDVRRESRVIHSIQGMVSSDPIAPGASLGCGAELDEATFFPKAGDYRVRLHHHASWHDFNQANDLLDGWICERSEEFTIRVRPHGIALSPGDRRRLRERFDAIALESPVILVSNPWHPDAEYTAPASTPEDDLFRAGWNAVPVLLDVLDRGDASIQARAWALALLSDITGLHQPDVTGFKRRSADDSEELAFGRYRAPLCWPGVMLPEGWFDTSDGRIAGPKLPDKTQQEVLIRRWQETRKSFDIHE
jgi:hypothetical protein